MSKSIHQSLRIAIFATIAIAVSIGAASAADRQNDLLPMYGQPKITSSQKMQQLDEAFIQQATAGANGDRKAAAKTARDAAEGLMGSNPDEAMRRFNQAWLLDPTDFQPFWGFGRIQLIHNHIDDAIVQLDKAAELAPDPGLKSMVLVDSGLAYSLKASRVDPSAKNERNKLFAKASDMFQQSTTLDSTNANAWLRWSQSLYREEKYADAWAKLKKVAENGGQAPRGYVKSLTEKMPEPK